MVQQEEGSCAVHTYLETGAYMALGDTNGEKWDASSEIDIFHIQVFLPDRSSASSCPDGTFKGHVVQTPCNEQGHLQLDQVAQSPIQPDLECFQGWGIYHLSGKSVPVFQHSHCKKILMSSLNLPSFNFKPLPLVLWQQALLKVLKGHNKVSLEPSLLQAEQPQLSQTFFIGEVLQPSDHFRGPPLDLLQQVHVFLC
ncbi:hypothetical protein QYF61_013128 [Mycteria americana]|uniref:Uncharacterized protein n=1 Tax=Mycteria americana TaxID=33587 RepID=A0AAN7N5Q6_MYCAM|nr:hypothetical protein QYF61_013128 [Mycteria americana]